MVLVKVQQVPQLKGLVRERHPNRTLLGIVECLADLSGQEVVTVEDAPYLVVITLITQLHGPFDQRPPPLIECLPLGAETHQLWRWVAD